MTQMPFKSWMTCAEILHPNTLFGPIQSQTTNITSLLGKNGAANNVSLFEFAFLSIFYFASIATYTTSNTKYTHADLTSVFDAIYESTSA